MKHFQEKGLTYPIPAETQAQSIKLLPHVFNITVKQREESLVFRGGKVTDKPFFENVKGNCKSLDYSRGLPMLLCPSKKKKKKLITKN